MKTFTYSLIQDGVVVASVEAPTEDQALHEINHYALMYSDDGPMEIVKGRVKIRKMWSNP